MRRKTRPKNWSLPLVSFDSQQHENIRAREFSTRAVPPTTHAVKFGTHAFSALVFVPRNALRALWYVRHFLRFPSHWPDCTLSHHALRDRIASHSASNNTSRASLWPCSVAWCADVLLLRRAVVDIGATLKHSNVEAAIERSPCDHSCAAYVSGAFPAARRGCSFRLLCGASSADCLQTTRRREKSFPDITRAD